MLKKIRNRDTNCNLEKELGFLHLPSYKTKENNNKMNRVNLKKMNSTKTLLSDYSDLSQAKTAFGTNTKLSIKENKDNLNLTNIKNNLIPSTNKSKLNINF